MKRTYSFTIVLLITIIAVVTNRFMYLPAIEQLFFVPFTFYFFILLVKIYPRYLHVLGFTAVSAIVSIFANKFEWNAVILEFIWNVIGTIITLLTVTLYRHLVQQEEDTN